MRGDRKFLDWRHLMAAGILLPLLILCGCTDVPKLPSAPPAPASTHYLIQPGDTLDVKFQYNPELDDQPTVAPDGRISLIYAPNMKVGGLTTEQVRQEISQAYSQQLIKPAVTVAIHGAVPWRIFVGGQVNKPNEYTGTGPVPSLAQVIKMAGGVADTGDGNKIVLHRRSDGKQIVYTAKYSKVANGKRPERDTQLASGDALYVPRTGVADVYLAFSQYFIQFVPSNVKTSYGIFGTAPGTIPKAGVTTGVGTPTSPGGVTSTGATAGGAAASGAPAAAAPAAGTAGR